MVNRSDVGQPPVEVLGADPVTLQERLDGLYVARLMGVRVEPELRRGLRLVAEDPELALSARAVADRWFEIEEEG